MLVKELIEELKKYDGELRVDVEDTDNGIFEILEVVPGTDYEDEDMHDAIVLWCKEGV